jgi:hypothetical protein
MGWTLFFMVVVLKIPLAAACYLIWYAVRAEPEPAGESDSGPEGGPRRRPPLFPRWPRRGPVGGGAECKPLPCTFELPLSARPAGALARMREGR